MFNNEYRNCSGFLLILLTAFMSACNFSSTEVSKTSKNTAEINKAQLQPSQTPFVKPISQSDDYPQSLRATWQKFTSSGQYRLAQPSDMRFPNNHKDTIPQHRMPFVYIWGDLNYDKRVDDNHLAAIVVDTTKSGDNRFSLVIFSPIKEKKDIFETNWVYRDTDLSKTIIDRASSSLSVRRYSDESSQGCFVEWNQRKKQFDCN